VCALILSAHPELTAMQVIEALRNTANNSSTPNNVYGYGLINAYKAILYFGEVWGNEASIIATDSKVTIKIGFASNDFTTESPVILNYRTPQSKKFKTVNMKLVKQFENGNYSGVYEYSKDNTGNAKFNKDEFEYYFSVVINGKELKSTQK
jgi:hypothetical protein